MIKGAHLTVAGTLFAWMLLGCGASDGPPGGPPIDGEPTGMLIVDPGDLTLAVDDGTAATATYAARYIDEDGQSYDVTSETEFTLSTSVLGEFDGALLTTAPDRAGRATVKGTYGSVSAEARLVVTLNHTIVEDGTPADAPDRFGSGQPGGVDPTLIYPNPGILVPPNLNSLEFQYLPGAGNNLFELSFTGELVGLKIYFTCTTLGAGCAYEPSETTWELLGTAGRGEQPLFYTLRALDSSGKLGLSATNSVQFAGDDLLGGIYYWNAGGSSIMRYEFGRRGQTAETYLSVAQTTGTTCVGCHVLNRQGTRIAVGLDIPGPAKLETYSVSDRAMMWNEGGTGGPGGFGQGGANFMAYSPDSLEMLTSAGANIQLRDAETGSNPEVVINKGTMPDWSPRGDQVVFSRSGAGEIPCIPPFPCDGGFGGNPGVQSGSLMTTVPGNWGNESTLVAANGDNNYYPAYSPDSDWVIFNKNHSQDSFDAPDGEIWSVPSAGGTAVRLKQAAPNAQSDSWPKMAPFTHVYHDGQVFWFTFSSRRDYGLRIKNDGLPHEDQRAQIWMAAFDPARAAQGLDGSFAGFWLPFQDGATGNHIAQWVEEVDRQECNPDMSCPGGELCQDGRCYPDID